MKTLFILNIALLFYVSSHAQWWGKGKSIKGNGNVTTIDRTTSDYDQISCAGFMDFTLVSGAEGNITIEGEENLLEYIITEVKENRLVVKVKKNTNLKTSWNKNIVITIPFNDIDKVSLSGSGDLNSNAVINAENLEVSLSGSGDIVLEVEATSLEGSLAGSGDITLKGKTNTLEARVAGSGNFNAFNLDSNITEASVAGSGDANVVSNYKLKARVAGSGDITYKGNPEEKDTKVSGSGDISRN